MTMQTPLYTLIHSNHVMRNVTQYEFSTIEKYLYFKGLEKGEILFSEGEYGDFMAFVVAGQVEIFVTFEQQEKRLTIKKIGDSLGDMAVIDDLSRSASARALERTGLIMLSKNDFNRILVDHPHIGIKMLKGLAGMISLQLRKSNTIKLNEI